MGKSVLVADKQKPGEGTTLFAGGKNACMKETGVYLPPNHDFSKGKVNVVLWAHGFYVRNVRDILTSTVAKHDVALRQGVIAGKKDVVLVAPFLGYQYESGQGTLTLGDMGLKNGCQVFLNQVVGALASYRSSVSKQPAAGVTSATGKRNP